MKSLYYFRNDYRIEDNLLLTEALKSSSEIAFLAKRPQDNWGKYRNQFVWECLEDLNRNLQRIGHKLWIIEEGDLQQDLGYKDITLYTPKINADYEIQEVESLKGYKEVICKWNDRLLLNFPYKEINQFPDIFTDFRKSVENCYRPLAQEQTPKVLPDSFKPSIGSSLTERIVAPKHPKTAFPFLGGESKANERLIEYTFEGHYIQTYKQTRNGLIGRNYSTKLSPYLALGCISPQQIYRAVLSYEEKVKENEDTYWVKFELWWREYFRWVFEKYPKDIFKKGGIKRKKYKDQPDLSLFDKWINGNTGDSFVDANMIELKETGWMSNRGRQNVASFLVKDLNLPWRWGAEYFENELIDYDVFSNWGNWQYVAGVGNDPRPNRYFNTTKQALIYDKDGTFRNLWLGPNPND